MEKGPSQVTHYIFTTFARGACPFFRCYTKVLNARSTFGEVYGIVFIVYFIDDSVNSFN